jgi:phosphatidylglycerol:prolipoprotein diacylglycerol transferase
VGPLIPYISLPELKLSFLTYIPILGERIDPAHPPSIKPFGTLVALGVYIGSIIATRHARERGLDLRKMGEFIFWVVAAGFIGGHMLDAIFYHPARVERDPLYLFMLWDGLSSYGGFTGALIGAFSWRFYRGERILGYAECINSAFPLAWVFGRAGCSVVHDHPGKYSDAWFAVRYPLGEGFIGRYDLGLYECILSIPLAVAFAILWRRRPKRPLGFYTGIMCIAYAPVRFFLDFLRADEASGVVGGDPRYGGLTPAQWASFGLLGVGVYFLSLTRRGAMTVDELAPAGANAGVNAGAATDADADARTDTDADARADADTAAGADAPGGEEAGKLQGKRRARKKRRAAGEEPEEPSE